MNEQKSHRNNKNVTTCMNSKYLAFDVGNIVKKRKIQLKKTVCVSIAIIEFNIYFVPRTIFVTCQINHNVELGDPTGYEHKRQTHNAYHILSNKKALL